MKKILPTFLLIIFLTIRSFTAHAFIPTPLNQGGTGLATSTPGDILVGTSSASQYTRLPIGNNGYVLTSNGSTPIWQISSAGGGGGGCTSATPYGSVQYAALVGTSTCFGSTPNFTYSTSTNILSVLNSSTTNATTTNLFTSTLSLGATGITYIRSLIDTYLGSPGTGISYSSGVITNTGVTSNVAGTGISVSGATGAVTIGNTGVLSIGGQTGAVATGTLGLQASGNYITALTGDISASGPGSAAATLATVNGNIGSFTNANVTVNAKGLITAVSNGTGGSGGLSTTSPWTPGNIAFVVSNTNVSSVATGTPLSGTGLSWNGSGSLVGGSNTISAASGFNIPLTASTSQWAMAFASTSALSATSPVIYIPTTGVISCPTCNVSNATVSSITATSPLTGGTISSSGSIGCQTASGSQAGCLASADWTTFNNKLSNLLGGLNAILGNSTTTNATTTNLSVTNLTVTGPATSTYTPPIYAPCFTTDNIECLGQQQNFKSATEYVTVAALPSNTYLNGSSGRGATITGVGVGGLSVDGSSVIAGDRILVNNEATQANNGIYSVTAPGSGIAAFVLTRATDFDESADMNPGDSVFVVKGATQATTTWSLTATTTIVVGTSPIVFAKVSNNGSGTVNSGTTGQVAYYPSSGTAISGASGLFFNSSNGYLGSGTTTPSEGITVVGAGILNTETKLATSSSQTVSLASSTQQLIQMGTGAMTITLTNLINGQANRVIVCNPAAGTAGSITWATSPVNLLLWANLTTPTQTTTANRCDLYTFTVTQASSTQSSNTLVFGAQIPNY